jgi:hypothetical protein
MAILVFPSSLAASIAFAEEARRWGQTVIGASSLESEPKASAYSGWLKLPFISDESFFDELATVVDEHGIRSIYTPHPATYHLLTRDLPTRIPGVALRDGSPVRKLMEQVESNLSVAQAALASIDRLTGVSSDLTPAFVAALLAQANKIPGECTDTKVAALCGIFENTPRGDVVEIGSLFGKSAYVMNRLASRFKTGATIAVDPWNMELSIQRDSPSYLQELSPLWDWDLVFAGFLLTMQACATPPFNYIRAPSSHAWMDYERASAIESAEFGRTPISGVISVLHIDGNHDEQCVREDFTLWSSRLAPGGWLIFDDYEWSHGEGPRRIGDWAIANLSPRIDRHFVAGGALFLKTGA